MNHQNPVNRTLSIIVAVVGIITMTAVLSRYPGLIDLRCGKNCGVTIDGRLLD